MVSVFLDETVERVSVGHMILFLTPRCVCLNSQLKSFGAKLKERNNLFRKTSKVQSHEMKEVLYSDLVQANLVRGFTQKY